MGPIHYRTYTVILISYFIGESSVSLLYDIKEDDVKKHCLEQMWRNVSNTAADRATRPVSRAHVAWVTVTGLITLGNSRPDREGLIAANLSAKSVLLTPTMARFVHFSSSTPCSSSSSPFYFRT
jgi:hypothetical protein